MIPAFAIVPLFVATAIAEITGCYLVFLWLRQGRSPLLLIGAALSLAIFTWLLSLHPHAGRAYAAYGGVYIGASLAWLWAVEGVRPDRADVVGACLCLLGAAVILFGRPGVRSP